MLLITTVCLFPTGLLNKNTWSSCHVPNSVPDVRDRATTRQSRPGLLWSLHSRVESWKEYGKKGEGERDGRVELPGHTGTPCLRTYEVPDCFPKGLHHFASLQQSMWVPISLHSRQHLLLSDFQKITIMNLIFKLIYLLLKQNHR